MSAPVLSAETLAQIVSKAAGDSAFRSKLLDAPHEALASLGIRLPEGLTVRFVQDTAGTRHFVLPPLAGASLPGHCSILPIRRFPSLSSR